MARPNHKKNVRKHKKFSNKPKPKSKPKFSNRDIKHLGQIAKYKKNGVQTPKPAIENEMIIEDEIDPLSMLLSTFDNVNKNSRYDAIESEDEDSEDDVVNDPMTVEQIEPTVACDKKPEEGADESELEIVVDDDEEDHNDNEKDPFNLHFSRDIASDTASALTALPRDTITSTLYWPILKNVKFEVLKYDSKCEKQTLLEPINYARPGEAPTRISTINWNEQFMKSQIQGNIKNANRQQLTSTEEPLTELQKELFSAMLNYQDFFFPERNFENGEEIRFIYALHAVNHLLKSRLKVIHHNARLNKKDRFDVPEEFRDQGLVRPKVLIIVPFRESCYRIVNMIIDIVLKEDKGNVINKIRFKEEFTGSELVMPKRSRKPEDFEQLFAGNVDDSFRIGITLTKKSIKLYADFYSSDLIIASPLGLRMLIGAEGDRERDYDFLASIELLILDQADVFLMQNWDHVIHIFDHMHMQPRETHGTDFSRVRSWAVNGWAKFYRQTLLFSSFLSPELNALFNRKCLNYAGALRLVNPCDVGYISRVLIPVPQLFRKFQSESIAAVADERFEYFTQNILPQILSSAVSGVLLYIPSYFDFVRIRNYMKKEDFNLVQICEYSKDSKVARARDMFFHDEARFLLYSERFHYFHRINLKGIRHLVFYQPPTIPHFYSEMCNLMQEGNQNKYAASDGNMSVTVIYSKYDVHALSAIVKTSRAAKMIASEKNVHMYTTGL